jgi:type I restriction enzyme S subunit
MAGELAQSLPDSWEVRRLDEVATIIDSLHKTPSYSEVGGAMVRVTDVQGGFLDLSKTLRVTEEVFQEFTRRYQPKKGDMVISRVGSYGNVSYARTETPFCLGQNTALISPRINGRFLHQFLQSSEARWQIEQLAVGSTQKTISLKSINALQIPIPPPDELEAIAAMLGALDDKIELNRRMNATLEAMARALFQSWFVDFDPVRAKLDGRQPEGMDAETAALFPEHLVDSPLGHIPKGWKCGTISELAARISNKVKDPADWASEPLIDLSRMPQRSVALGEWGPGAELTTSVTRFLPRDILFGAIRPYFHKVGIAPVHGVTNVSVFVVRARKSFDWVFLAALCSLDSTVEFATRVSKGTKMPVVGWPDFSNYSVVVPPAELRQKFADAVAPLYEGIIANIHQSRTLTTLRDTLLPKLLSGEIEISNKKKD